jgi:membrane-associated phospholipid phosphatase
MPSSHTALAVFVAAVRILLLARSARSKSLSTLLLGAAEALTLVGSAIAVGASRVYLGYHSDVQVYAAGVVGLAWALVWYTLVVKLSSSFEAFCRSWLGRAFHFKNTWHIPDVLSWEQQQARQHGPGASKLAKVE